MTLLKTITFGATALVAVSASAAYADTTYAADQFNGIAPGGNPYTPTGITAFGQYFTAPGGAIQSLTFTDTDELSGGTVLKIAAFDPSGNFAPGFSAGTISGTSLYTSTAQTETVVGYGDGSNNDGTDFFYNHTFSDIGLNLTAGDTYIAYLAEANGSDAFNGSTSPDDSDPNGDGSVPLGGNFYFATAKSPGSSLGGAFVFDNGGTFYQVGDPPRPGYQQALYSFTFADPVVVTPPTSAVPEPATWAMMIGGFGLAGGAMRRRQRTSVTFA